MKDRRDGGLGTMELGEGRHEGATHAMRYCIEVIAKRYLVLTFSVVNVSMFMVNR